MNISEDEKSTITYYEKLYDLKYILYLDSIKDTEIEKSVLLSYPEFIPYLHDKALLYKELNKLINYYLDLTVLYLSKIGVERSKDEVLEIINESLKHSICYD